MEHPLLAPEHKELRQRVFSHIHSSYMIRRESNIIFVCGGNDDAHMRPQFLEYCKSNLAEYDAFKPEQAMDFLSVEHRDYSVNLGQFEELIAEASHSVVIFPEATGSFVETGYFANSNKGGIRSRFIVVFDYQFQGKDSFISKGPAELFNKHSYFSPCLYLNYQNIEFSRIADRIKRKQLAKYRKAVELDSFSGTPLYTLMQLIQIIVSFMEAVSIDDMIFSLNWYFKGRASRPKAIQILSVLIGLGYLQQEDRFGLITPGAHRSMKFQIRDGRIDEDLKIKRTVHDLNTRSGLDALSRRKVQ